MLEHGSGVDLLHRGEGFRLDSRDREPPVRDVRHDAGDLPRLAVTVGIEEAHPPSDGRGTADHFARERLVDHEDPRSTRPVAAREQAPVEETQPHRVEVARARHPEQRLRRLTRAVRRRSAVDLHLLHYAAAAREREARRHPDRLHPGKTGQAVHRPGELAVEASFRRLRLDALLRGPEARENRQRVPGAGGHHVGRVVAAIEGDEADEAAQEKPRSHQEHEGQCHLRGGQDRPRPVGAQQPEAARGPCAPFDEGSEQVASGRLEGGDGAEQQSDHHRQAEREGEDDAVEPDLVEPRHRARHQRGHGAKHGGGRRQCQRAAAQAQQDALGKELTHVRQRAGAQVHGRSRHASRLLPDAHDALAVRIRQRPDQHAVDDAEHRGGDAGAQREDEHHRGREAGGPPEAADGVAQVAPEVVEPAPAPDVASALADQGVVAQLPPGCAQGLVLRDAGVPLAFPLQLQVERELLLQILLGLAPAEIRHQPAEPCRRLHRVASPAPAGCMTRPTASTIRSHLVASRRSCPRPASVRA